MAADLAAVLYVTDRHVYEQVAVLFAYDTIPALQLLSRDGALVVAIAVEQDEVSGAMTWLCADLPGPLEGGADVLMQPGALRRLVTGAPTLVLLTQAWTDSTWVNT